MLTVCVECSQLGGVDQSPPANPFRTHRQDWSACSLPVLVTEIFQFSEGRTRSSSSLNLLVDIYLMLNTGQNHVACVNAPQEASPASSKCCETLMGTSRGSRVERSKPNTAAVLEPGTWLLPRDRP